MIKIKVADIKEFLRRSKHIKANTIIPILGYVKLECRGDIGLLYKTNIGCYCIHEMPVQSDKAITLLLDEKKLSVLCGDTTAEEITIKYDGKRVFVSDGSSNNSYETSDVADFNQFPEGDLNGKITTLDAPVIAALSTAKNFVDVKGPSNFSFVHIKEREGKWDVMAANGPILYLKSFDIELPPLILSVEACNILSMYEKVNHYVLDNYDFFDTGNTKYGFVKNEYSTPMYEFIVDQAKKEGGFIIAKERLVNFCERTISLAYSQTPISVLKDGDGDTIVLEYSDTNFNDDNQMSFQAEKVGVITPFTFNPKQVLPAIKSIPYDVVYCCQMGINMYSIWSSEDDGFLAIFAGLNVASN